MAEMDVPEANDRRLNRAVATTVVILSVAMALTKIKDDNIVQAMQADQAAQIDVWSEYQAARLKLHFEGAAGRPAAKYAAESNMLKAKALAAKADYDHAGYRDDQFDLADGFASIALATTAIAALVESWWLLGFGWASGTCALAFSIAGFAQWPLHPDLIVGWLT